MSPSKETFTASWSGGDLQKNAAGFWVKKSRKKISPAQTLTPSPWGRDAGAGMSTLPQGLAVLKIRKKPPKASLTSLPHFHSKCGRDARDAFCISPTSKKWEMLEMLLYIRKYIENSVLKAPRKNSILLVWKPKFNPTDTPMRLEKNKKNSNLLWQCQRWNKFFFGIFEFFF